MHLFKFSWINKEKRNQPLLDKNEKNVHENEHFCEHINRALHTQVSGRLHAKMVVRLGCALALHGPENSNKWPLGFFSLESSKVPKGFSSPITTLISLHSRKTNRKKEYDSWIIAVHKRCLKAWSVSSTKRKMSDGELPGNACWQDEVETQLHVSRKGEDVWFVLCSLRMAPRSSSNVIQD